MTEGTRTKLFLRQISNHLSSRDGCSKIEYEVIIHEQYVECKPVFYVFSSAYSKSRKEMHSLLYHIANMHVPELQKGIEYDSHFGIPVNSGLLVPGTYVYRFSFKGKRRKWVRIVK